MKRKKFLALALAGAVLTVSLTACTPLDAVGLLYDWLFGGGSSNASRSNGTGIAESETLENKLKAYLGLSETTASDKAKETLEAVAKGFDAGWLGDNNMLNEEAVNALVPIRDDKLQVNQALLVDVMELTSPGEIADITLDNRAIYLGVYEEPGPGSGDPYHWAYRPLPSQLEFELTSYNKNGAELYAGTFQKDGKNYAAMVTIMNHL